MEKLIFDIGFHTGEDTFFYLLKDYRVIAVDADSELIEKGKRTFKKSIESGKLTLLNYAISSENDKDIDFFISQYTLWSSTKIEISSRMGTEVLLKQVKSKRLDYLFQEYGVPFYCKIDIEGNDIIALQALENVSERPQYISVETECIGDNEILAGEEFDTLDSLYQLGYRKFKLVDQRTLTVLSKECFYKMSADYCWSEQTKTNCRYAREQIALSKKDRHSKFTDFFPCSSGPFGTDLAGRWYGYKQAKEILKMHREDRMKLGEPVWSFWCDWHATF